MSALLDACDAVIALVAANAAGINANAKLVAAGVSLSTAAGTGTGDTSAYKHIKRGDRLALPAGLSICVVPDAMEEVGRLTGDVSERRVSIAIVAYVAEVSDPDKAELARAGIGEALRSLLNRTGSRTLTAGSVTFYGATVTREGYSYLPDDKMRALIGRVKLDFEALCYVQETTTDG